MKIIKLTENEFQRKLEGFVNREVIYRVSMLAQYLQEIGVDEWYDEFENLSICPEHGIECEDECETEPQKIYEYWIVTDWFANKLREHGEPIADNWHGLTVWGRGCSGQSIILDGVVRNIYKEIEEYNGNEIQIDG